MMTDETNVAQNQKQAARSWFITLRNNICAGLEELENEARILRHRDRLPGMFSFKDWDREGGGGGTMGLMRGRVFEKAGVNFSCVSGEFSEAFRPQIPGAQDDPRFWACGVSVVIHPWSPLIPPIHMNTRHIRTTKAWFGGGTDLNPILPNDQDTRYFHQRLEAICQIYQPDAYPRFSKWADDYFHLPHRGEQRGVGGIFFDYLEHDFDEVFGFVKDVGRTFLSSYMTIARRHINKPWSHELRRFQERRRGRYAEFNLIYDRGTKFGLQTGGNTEAILMSLPPATAWP